MHVPGAGRITSMTSTTVGGNWMQDVANATSDGADWMDPNSSSNGPDAVKLAANAIATAHQVRTTTRNSIAVNTGIALLSKQLSGNSVNILI